MYHFISGYTSKIAGTEIGLGIEPEITFSTCFGGAVHGAPPATSTPSCCARRCCKHGATCWLVNTGWTGGPFGVGKRISIQHTRALLNAALSGKLARRCSSARTRCSASTCRRPARASRPRSSTRPTPGGSREEYFAKYDALAARFIENFKLMTDGCPPDVAEHGPKRLTGAPARVGS